MILKERYQSLKKAERETSSNSTLSPRALPAELDLASAESKRLVDPFPVPDTGITLFVGSRRAVVPWNPTIWGLSFLVNLAWHDVANRHHVDKI